MNKFKSIPAILIICIFLITSGLCGNSTVNAAAIDTLVDLKKLPSNFAIDLRYATNNNFMKKKLYTSDICCLQESTAWKLIKANEEVMKSGFRIKIWDAYRPLSVQKEMWKKMPNSNFLANPYKGGSNHNKGCAVDITMVDSKGMEVEMPSGFDEFSKKASRLNSKMSATAKKNLKILTDAMVKSGFKYINTEWWHFDDMDKNKFSSLDVQPENIAKRKLAVEGFKCLGSSKQVILVTAPVKSYKASLRIYENKNGKWLKMASDMTAFIGRNGFKPVKNSPLTESEKNIYKFEGDSCSPAGAYNITSLFGWAENPGFHLPYTKVTKDDYWVSSSNKAEYNVLISKTGGPSKSWTIYEELDVPEYKYASVIDYNIGSDRIPGNGSAIFLHIASDKGYTSGCTAVTEANVLKILKWLKPEMKPMIVQGTADDLKKLK